MTKILKTDFRKPLSLKLRSLFRNSINLTCVILRVNRDHNLLPSTATHFPLFLKFRIWLPFYVNNLLSPYEFPISVKAHFLLMITSEIMLLGQLCLSKGLYGAALMQ